MEKEEVVVIGCGVAGLTAAIYASRANLNPLVISGQLPGGLLTQTSDVENYPGFVDGINGYELMATMQKQAEKFGTRVEYDKVEKFDFHANCKHVITLSSGKEIEVKAIIIATGATPRWLGLDSEENFKNRGVSACATCDGAFYRNMDVCVVGGGDTAMEEASFLTNFASKVYLIHRREEFRASQIMVERVKSNPKIELVLNSVVSEVLGDKDVDAVKVENSKDNTTKTIECKGLFVALGHQPATELLKNSVNLDEHGYIILKDNNSKTNIDGVFAAGDCADPNYRQAIHAAGMGCRAAMDVIKYLEK